MCVTSVVDGKESGLWVTWHRNAQKQSEGRFEAGLKNGQWTHWSSSGQRLGTNQWTQGNGQISDWLNDGKLGSQGRFKDGKKHGVWMQWWYDDSVEKQRSKGEYKDGKRSGQWTTWLSDGPIKQKNAQWNQGDCVKITCLDASGATVSCPDECG